MIDEHDSIALFIADWNMISRLYPNLHLFVPNGKPIIHGAIDLVDENGIVCDTYSIEIHWKPRYPFRFPWVFETGGRIPKNIEWHVFEADGNCCIKTIPEEIIQCKKEVHLTSFIKNEVVPYFFNQTFRRLNGYFLNERRHGFLGPLEFYEEILNTKDLNKIIFVLQFVLKRVEYKSTKKCFCGSQKKYKKCHRRKIRKLSVLPDNIITSFFDDITLAFKQAS